MLRLKTYMAKYSSRIVFSTCKRCGKPLATTSKPLHHGSATLKEKWELICADCVTPEEDRKMQDEIAQEIRALAH